MLVGDYLEPLILLRLFCTEILLLSLPYNSWETLDNIPPGRLKYLTIK